MEKALVKIIWHDAHAIVGTWLQLEDVPEDDPCVVETVGWLLAEVKNGHVVVAQSHNSQDGYDHILAIPVGMVVETKLLS